MFQRCLICTDFSDGLYRLVDFVPSLAKGGLKQIVFVHSVPLWEEGGVPRVDDEKIRSAQARLSAALINVPQGVEVKLEVPSGKPMDTIPEILDTYQSEVILTGTPISNVLKEKIFGSTSMGLAKLTSNPLMILRPQLISTYTREELELRSQHFWRYLLIPYNDGEAARYLISQIKEYAKNSPEGSLQKCMLMWVVSDSGRREIPIDYFLKEARTKLEAVKTDLESLGIQVNIEVRQGDPLLELLDAAFTFDISAIAIASDYRGNLLEWTAPSFANEVLRRSWFPILFFSPKK